MATVQLKGDASFTYTPTGGSLTTHNLAIPLWDVQPVNRGARYDWWAEDYGTREVVTVGDGVSDVLATIRLDNQPAALKTMLEAALREDLTLTYTQDSTDYYVRLVAVVGASSQDETPLQPDRDRLGYGEWECRVHLRAAGATLTLDGLWAGDA
jgi:hypothetical protein